MCCVAAVKCRPDFISVLLYFFWSFGINDSNTYNIDNWVPLKPVLGGGVRDVALSIISHEQTQQNRVCNFHYFCLVALEGSTFHQNSLDKFDIRLLIVFIRTGELAYQKLLFSYLFICLWKKRSQYGLSLLMYFLKDNTGQNSEKFLHNLLQVQNNLYVNFANLVSLCGQTVQLSQKYLFCL